jgi:hypothetical protein
MRELLFYDKPVALSREQHQSLRYNPQTSLAFSSQVNSVPLTGIEFFEASRDLPVLFNRDGDGHYFPLALLSLKNEGHQRVDEKGEWQGSYVPAFIRRYPFALTQDGTVCFDEQSTAFTGETGDALFLEEGKNSETLDRIVQFLQQYDVGTRHTREFCDALEAHQLFKPFTLQVMVAGQAPLRIDGLSILDEEKVAALPDAVVAEWFRKGWLAWIYAHLHSLGALQSLSKQLQPST